MGISGTDPALTAARLGVLRLGAGRLGWPYLAGVRVPLYSLLGVARLGATRLNYHSSKVFVSVDGIQRAYQRPDAAYAERYHVKDLVITDVAGATPSRASFLTKRFDVRNGMDVIVTLGSVNNLDRLFAGTILPIAQSYVGTPANREFHVSAIDYTWGLNKLRVTERYTSSSVAAIAADLMAKYAPPGYALRVQEGFDDIDEVTFTDQDLTACLTHLFTTRGGGDWKCDFHHVVRGFIEDTESTRPTILNAVHRSLELRSITRDPSRWKTRVYVEGGGANASAEVAPGETILPVEDAVWYPDAGTVKSGPQGPAQITYTGVDLGGGGGLVGPGAAPTSAPVATLATGAGVTDGVHNIAVTFVTASGESMPSPIATITVGLVAAPASAPIAGAPTIGTGPNPGGHDYAVTFQTASGETTRGPRVENVQTTFTAPPTSAPTPGTPTSGGSIDPGSHEYAVTNVTSIGEATPGPVSGQVTVGGGAISAPGVAPVQTSLFQNTLNPTGVYQWGLTFVTADGETEPGPLYTTNIVNVWDSVTFSIPTGPSGTTARKLYRTTVGGSQLKLAITVSDNTATSVVDGVANASLGANAPTGWTSSNRTVPLTGIPVPSDANVTSKNLYRRSGGAGLKLVANIAAAATTYTDTTANASLGAAAPTSNTAYVQRIPLTLPVGGPLVTNIKVYGTAAGGGQLKLIATLANGTTSYTVTTTDASLGANIPTVNTATANQIAVTGIAIGAVSVTSRKVYMTPAGSLQLKLVDTIANNTASTYTITLADGSLGANVPTSDASGLVQPQGQVLAGSTSIEVAGTGAFSTGGGWAVIGNGQQVVRYTGKTGAALTGIPASGAGAIVASIGFNSTITASPQLTGIPTSGPGSILWTIKKGESVNLFVQVDDLAGQAALSALLTTPEVAHDGIVEDSIQNRSLSYTEAIARGVAHLELHGHLDVAVQYLVRDQNTRAGRMAPFNLGAPTNLIDDLMIQEVTISNFHPALHPDFVATASRDRFSFEELLRVQRRQGE